MTMVPVDRDDLYRLLLATAVIKDIERALGQTHGIDTGVHDRLTRAYNAASREPQPETPDAREMIVFTS